MRACKASVNLGEKAQDILGRNGLCLSDSAAHLVGLRLDDSLGLYGVQLIKLSLVCMKVGQFCGELNKEKIFRPRDQCMSEPYSGLVR